MRNEGLKLWGANEYLDLDYYAMDEFLWIEMTVWNNGEVDLLIYRDKILQGLKEFRRFGSDSKYFSRLRIQNSSMLKDQLYFNYGGFYNDEEVPRIYFCCRVHRTLRIDSHRDAEPVGYLQICDCANSVFMVLL